MPLDGSDLTRLTDMLHYSDLACKMLGDRSIEAVQADEMATLALTRCVEIIGEAGHHVSADIKTAMPTVPWHMMYGMRNRLIHDYGNTDYGIVYKVAREELPGLSVSLRAFLAQHGYTA